MGAKYHGRVQSSKRCKGWGSPVPSEGQGDRAGCLEEGQRLRLAPAVGSSGAKLGQSALGASASSFVHLPK